MALTFAQARTIIQGDLGDSSDTTLIDQCLNQAQREVARAHRWPELMVTAFFNTEAAYSTGTVATAGTTTVTLTTGVWPSTVASSKHRFALSYSDPWYEVATRSSDTVILLAQAYIDSNVSASAYVAYKNLYSLAEAVDRVEEMWLHAGGRAVPLVYAATDSMLTDWSHFPAGAGVPARYMNAVRDSSGNRQVALGPHVPDDVYRVEYTYRKKTTDDTFTGNLDESRWPAILSLAKVKAYERDYYDRSLQEMSRYRLLLAEEWGNEKESEVQSVQVGEMRVQFPGGGDYLRDLMGYGRVADPS